MSNTPTTKGKNKALAWTYSADMYRAANILLAAFENARFAQQTRLPRSLADCIEEGLNDGQHVDREALKDALAVLQMAAGVVARRVKHGRFM